MYTGFLGRDDMMSQIQIKRINILHRWSLFLCFIRTTHYQLIPTHTNLFSSHVSSPFFHWHKMPLIPWEQWKFYQKKRGNWPWGCHLCPFGNMIVVRCPICWYYMSFVCQPFKSPHLKQAPKLRSCRVLVSSGISNIMLQQDCTNSKNFL